MSEQESEKKKYSYFVDETKYDTEHSVITGAFVKSQIQNFDPQYQLWVEGQHGQPDRQVVDTDSFDLAAVHGHLKFFIVPPANFGGCHAP